MAAEEVMTGPTQRWGMGWRSVVAGGLAVLLLATVVALRVQSRGPSEVVSLSDFDMAITSPSATAPKTDPTSVNDRDVADEPGAGSSTESNDVFLVHVAGAVKKPGIVELQSHARVFEAIDAAGGAAKDADLTQINLARTVSDGEQLVVARVGEVLSNPAPGRVESGDAQGSSEVLDINAATAAEFEELPGIGPVLAERIVTHREQVGGFAAVSDLADVSGIGPSIMGQIAELVRE